MGRNSDCQNVLRRLLANPFLVLELPPDADRAALERQGAKLLAMLAAQMPEARVYPTPLGLERRTAELVRGALGELRDPDKRLVHEWWARGLAAAWQPAGPGSERRSP
jgi:hypothetical protein